MSSSHQDKSAARELAVQFLYQIEAEKVFHFSESHFQGFVSHLAVPPHLVSPLRELAKGTLDRIGEIDPKIQDVSANWKLSRMPMVDRNTLRLAVFELLATDTPPKVVLNEAIELAKKYGAAESGAFVNGILDRLVRAMRPSN